MQPRMTCQKEDEYVCLDDMHDKCDRRSYYK